jgi:hypothetical protein
LKSLKKKAHESEVGKGEKSKIVPKTIQPKSFEAQRKSARVGQGFRRPRKKPR